MAQCEGLEAAALDCRENQTATPPTETSPSLGSTDPKDLSADSADTVGPGGGTSTASSSSCTRTTADLDEGLGVSPESAPRRIGTTESFAAAWVESWSRED